MNRELDQKENDLNKLKENIYDKNEFISKMNVINDFHSSDNLKLKSVVQKLNNEKESLEDKIKDLEEKIDNMYITKKSETALQLEIDHLKDDNLRLLNMLKTTEEFKDFAYLAEDCTGGVRYVKGSSIYGDGITGTNKLSAKCECSKGSIYPNCKPCKDKDKENDPFDLQPHKDKKKTCRIKECLVKKIQEDSVQNDSNWVPIAAFETLNRFAHKYRLNIDDCLAKELLYQLNNIWKEREAKQIQRIKVKLQTEILDLRRRLNNKDSSEQIISKNENRKLKEEAKIARIDGQIIHKKNDGMDLVNSALKVASTFHKTKTNLEAEIARLKKIVENKDNKMQETKELERMKFNEGALWIGNII